MVSPKAIENSGECLDVILLPEGFGSMNMFAKILRIIPCSMEVDWFVTFVMAQSVKSKGDLLCPFLQDVL